MEQKREILANNQAELHKVIADAVKDGRFFEVHNFFVPINVNGHYQLNRRKSVYSITIYLGSSDNDR